MCGVQECDIEVVIPRPGGGGVTGERRFAPASAGAVMSERPMSLPQTLSVEGAIDALRRHRDVGAAFYYLYVTDDCGRLVGVASMRDLALASAAASLSKIMRRDVVSVPADLHQEEVARLLTRHGYLALPVVDDGGRLLGLVTADDVMRVIAAEADEDVRRMAGASPRERLTGPWPLSLRSRLPWLLVNLGLVGIAASVIRPFEGTIAAWAALAMYLPVVAGMGGNAGAQAMAVAIRGIATGEAGQVRLGRHLGRVVRREALVGAASGVVVGLLAAGVLVWLGHDRGLLLAGIVAASLFVTQTIACVWGATVPFLMRALGFDPAQSATIFMTTLTDMVGFFTLLGLATVVLSLAG